MLMQKMKQFVSRQVMSIVNTVLIMIVGSMIVWGLQRGFVKIDDAYRLLISVEANEKTLNSRVDTLMLEERLTTKRVDDLSKQITVLNTTVAAQGKKLDGHINPPKP